VSLAEPQPPVPTPSRAILSIHDAERPLLENDSSCGNVEHIFAKLPITLHDHVLSRLVLLIFVCFTCVYAGFVDLQFAISSVLGTLLGYHISMTSKPPRPRRRLQHLSVAGCYCSELAWSRCTASPSLLHHAVVCRTFLVAIQNINASECTIWHPSPGIAPSRRNHLYMTPGGPHKWSSCTH
jgi:hypothetical protein